MSAIAVIATMRVLEGKNGDFEAAFEKAVPAVLNNEEGSVVYTLTQSPDDSQLYRVLEVYKDADAVAAHGKADHFKELFGALKGTLAAAPEVEKLNVKF